MAIENVEKRYHPAFPGDFNLESPSNPPRNKVIQHDRATLSPNARRQREIYINKMLKCPRMKSVYVEKLNEIITIEQSKGRGLI